MKALNSSLTDLLKQDLQFRIPIYQRKYSWEKKQVEKLCDDIITVSESKRPCHFIGSIISLQEEIQTASALKMYYVIDGQQRLTTLSLLMLALIDYMQEFCGDDRKKLEDNKAVASLRKKYLENEDEDGDLKYKLKLNSEDFAVYKRLLEGKISKEDAKTAIVKNYFCIKRKLQKANKTPQSIFDGIKKLVFVDITLAPEDNAQLVFETVNSTGKALSVSDLIRNYVLMSSATPAEQDKLYKEYWRPLVKMFDSVECKNKFDDFVQYYLTIKHQRSVGKENQYDEFKRVIEELLNAHRSLQDILEELTMYARQFERFMKANSQDKGKIERKLYHLKRSGLLQIVSVVLLILYSNRKGKFEENVAEKILSMLESYVYRRLILKMPTNTVGNAVISMLKCLNQQGGDFVENFKRTLFKELTDKQGVPSDDKILEGLKTVNFYNLKCCKDVLNDMECHLNKDYVPCGTFTIEHIMPQSLTDEWKTDLGNNWENIHKSKLHTIGNLTLSAYNSEYQNYTFIKKRDMKDGYKESPIRLSKSLRELEHWGEQEILERSQELGKVICEVWPYSL